MVSDLTIVGKIAGDVLRGVARAPVPVPLGLQKIFIELHNITSFLRTTLCLIRISISTPTFILIPQAIKLVKLGLL